MIKEERIKQIISESINKIITESFVSSKIRDFFKAHNGVNREYRNFSIGDIADEQIVYWEEFKSAKEASKEKFHLDMQYRYKGKGKVNFYVFVANDGASVVVGIGGNPSDFGTTFGGEFPKKVSDRLNRNGWNFKTRDNRYVDDSDTYYYGGGKKRSMATDFGMYTNNDFKNKLNNLRQNKENTPKEIYDKWRDDEYRHMKDYLKRNYGR